MNVLLFGIVGYLSEGWPVVVAVLMAVVGLFVAATTRKDREREQDRRAGLGCAAILCGPLVGVFLAGLATHLGNVHPLDVRFTYTVFIGIGAVAGFITGCAFAVTSFFSPRDSAGKKSQAKARDPWEEF